MGPQNDHNDHHPRALTPSARSPLSPVSPSVRSSFSPFFEKPLPPMPEHDSAGDDAVHIEVDYDADSAGSEELTSWLEPFDSDEKSDMTFLPPQSAALPPNLEAMYSRQPRVATSSANSSPQPQRDFAGQEPVFQQNMSLLDGHLADIPPSLSSTASGLTRQLDHSPLLRSKSEGEAPSSPDSSPVRSFARPPKVPSLPDPSQFPDPYPYHPPQHRLSSATPALSSAGSSSASTRSSAYTSAGSMLTSSDYGHVQVVSGEEEEVGIAVGITSDDVVHLLANEGSGSSGRVPIDQTRWSQYSVSRRSRSSSIGNGFTNSVHENGVPRLHQYPSFDMGTHAVDERDEAGLTSEDDVDDTGDDDDDDGGEEMDEEDLDEEEPTSAVILAEEGRGLIVKGEGVPIVQLHVEKGTTHLLVGSSTTPNAVPAFLTNTLPQICNTLLALDISANFLVALPPALASCSRLEELNIASNPLRVLPVFLSQLVSLRVLIADSTSINTLPDSLCELDKLHTLSIRRNKLYSLPSWLCVLPSLQTLFVDGNPFQGPWKALVEPLLAKAPMTPIYPPSTPMFPLLSASVTSTSPDADTDVEDLSDPPTTNRNDELVPSPEEEDTITPARSPFIGRSATSPSIPSAGPQRSTGSLVRVRTTPNRSFYNKTRPRATTTVGGDALSSIPDSMEPLPSSSKQLQESGYAREHELRKMKSADEMRRSIDHDTSPRDPLLSTPARPPLPHHAISAPNTSLIPTSRISPETDQLLMPKRFASLGVSSPSRHVRPALTQSLWDNISDESDGGPESATNQSSPSSKDPSPRITSRIPSSEADKQGTQSSTKDGKEKSGRWGFLKKMSMGKMKPDSPASSRISVAGRPFKPEVILPSTSPSQALQSSPSPQINIRFSTTGSLSTTTTLSPPDRDTTPVDTSRLAPSASSSSSHLLAVPSLTPRSAKRRSFLPIDGTISLAVPSPTRFVYGVTVSDETHDSDESRRATPSPTPFIDTAELALRKEEDKAREAYTRALRSVMAYLKDMNDLGQSQANTMSIYGGLSDDMSNGSFRARRPTVIENRTNSESSVTLVSRSTISSQARSTESRASSSVHTMSIATSDSGGSEERKYKDDKGKRAKVIREIVETERTYVKGLQELVDIYIKPSAALVSLITGTSKETVVPASERKVVFSGIDSLFSFHKESFLPALEVAATPLMKPSASEESSDGQLSVEVAKAVAGIFLNHAAFMKMYSTYINNFDSSVQRVKHWTSDRTGGSTTPAGTLSPSSSTAQLVGLGIAMAGMPTPSVPDSASPTSPAARLSSGQRKRIKAFINRCRKNPRHSQLNLEGYLLLPVQRIPRYRLLLEELLRCTPPAFTFMDDSLDKALAEISSLANNMNEGKRESESRRKLVHWQSRIRGKFPSPLVQPHRRLIMDGPLRLTRVVRKTTVSFETYNAQGDASTVQVDCLAPELTPRQLVGILCNDLLVLCRDPSEGQDSQCYVDLWAVLRMQTLPQPASIVHGNALRLVDNKAILYFDAPTPSDALNWFRAINLHIPASQS